MPEPVAILEGVHDNLIIGEDDMGDGPIACFLFTPNMDDTTNHFHIELPLLQAEKLHKWLGEYLNKHNEKLEIERLMDII